MSFLRTNNFWFNSIYCIKKWTVWFEAFDIPLKKCVIYCECAEVMLSEASVEDTKSSALSICPMWMILSILSEKSLEKMILISSGRSWLKIVLRD